MTVMRRVLNEQSIHATFARAKPMGLIEIHEQEWFPNFFRDQVTDALQFILNGARIYQKSVSRLAPVFRGCGTTRVLDLCSGGSGPWPWIHRALAESGLNSLQVVLTDKHPNQVTVQKVTRKENNICYIAQPVDALEVPPVLSGFRTMFSSFHHFDREQAIRILQNAVDDGEGIAIFEVARPCPWTMALTSLMLFAGFGSALFMRPIHLKCLFWTCVVPIVPLVLFWDGFVSCLRSYSTRQLSEMVSSLRGHDYTWEVGEDTAGLVTVTFLIGYPPFGVKNRQSVAA
jgi:hypothetical protein